MKSLPGGILLILLASFCGPVASAQTGGGICNVTLNAQSSQPVTLAEVTVPGIAVGRVLRLTKDEYIARALKDELTPMDFIVIDEFPTELDPFPVAGVLSGTAFPNGCHMEVLAEKMGIPLIYAEGAYQNPEWAAIGERPGLHLFEFTSGAEKAGVRFDLGRAEVREHFRKRAKKIKLGPVDRGFTKTLPIGETTRLGFNPYGQKLGNFNRATRLADNYDGLPDLMGIAEGAYYRYLETVYPNRGASFEEELAGALKRMQSSKATGEKIPAELLRIQQWFETTEIPEALLESIVSAIERHYGTLDLALRFRSSNRIEDSLGAGIYDSKRLAAAKPGTSRETRKHEISKAIRDVWKSLWTYRAYLVRDLYGLGKSPVDIAIEVHPSYDDELFSGVASFSEYYGDQVLRLTSYPRGLSPTSPGASDRRETIHVIRKASGKLYYSYDGTTLLEAWTVQGTLMGGRDYVQLINRFKSLYDGWVHGSSERVRLDFEWIVRPPEAVGQPNRELVLQVKEAALQSLETVETRTTANLPPEVVRSLRTQGRNREADALTTGLSALGDKTELLQLRDVIARSLSEGGVLAGVAFYYVEIGGHRVMLFGGWHQDAYNKLIGYARLKSQSFRLLEIGRLWLTADHVGDRVVVSELRFAPASGTTLDESSVLKRDASRLDEGLFREMVSSIEIPGVIELADDLALRARPGNHRFSGISEGRFRSAPDGN